MEAGTMCGLTVQGVTKLALRPRHGVHEFFVSCIRSPSAHPWHSDEKTLLAIIDGPGVGRFEEEDA
jgi:23S rRNA (cytidine1920-2'-O)/16S rRNA (cytidine1409-2'-O)-methyltransferase